MRNLLALSLAVGASAFVGCGTEGSTVEHFGPEDTQPIAARTSSVLMEGCKLDAWQTSQLAASSAHRVLQEVILLCPSMRATGDVAPVDPDARAALAAQVNALRQLGYKVRLAVTLADDLGVPLSADRDDLVFASQTWRTTVIDAIATFAKMADGIEIDLQRVPSSIRPYLTQFFSELSSAVRLAGPNSNVGVFAPPSVAQPSDIQGADAYDLRAIAANVDRVRLMTLDFSGGAMAGPTIDSGWAVDVARLALSQVGSTPIDVAVPLYGTDFSAGGARPVTYLEATGIAAATHSNVLRGPNGTLHFQWNDAAGGRHETWFDDGASTARILHAWDRMTLPGNVGVVFYGLGAEDPVLWDTVARGMQ